MLLWKPIKPDIFMKLTVLGPYLSYYNGYTYIMDRKTRDTPKMIHNVCTLEWKLEIGCHGYFVFMVTSQKSHFHGINSFGVISFLL